MKAMKAMKELRWFVLLLVSTALFAQEWPQGKWIDLTHPFNKDTVYWPTAEGFKMETVFAGETDKGYHYEAYNYAAAEHGGTHLDSPIHFSAGKWTVDQIPLRQLAGAARVVDVSKKALKNPDYQVTKEDLLAFEKQHGPLPEGCILLLHTGYGRFWPDREKYMGTAERGADAVPKLHFPGLHPDAARWLVANRKIAAVGLDTPSIDFGQSTHYESHQILFGKNIPALENVAHLDLLPPLGALVMALPMKIEGGSGGPARILAIIPSN